VEINEIQTKLKSIRDNVSSVVVGMNDVTDTLLIALLSDGHVLLEGKPGVGKTTMAKTFAQTIGGRFQRIQMTPDLLPSDVLGVNMFNPEKRVWELHSGPIFGNIVLIDELNRASPKVQSAFLEVMQEKQVTIEGKSLVLGKPFMVIATQVPYGEAGTYPLTTVQVDRFAYKVSLDYPKADEEVEILRRMDLIESISIDPMIQLTDVVSLGEHAKLIQVHERINRYLVNLVTWLRASRYIRAGPGPRASISLMKGCRVRALMEGRDYVIPDDVKFLADKALPHRMELTPQARADEVSTESLVRDALKAVEVPKDLD
jgi:MoxR-like ATPase